MFEWEDPLHTSFALLTYCLVLTYLEVWALPLLPLAVMTYHLQRRRRRLAGQGGGEEEEEECSECGGEGGRQEGEDWSITKGIREMMQRAVWMQEMMGSVADRVEKIHNLFNFTVPFISGVFYCVLLLLMGLLYLVPIRYYHSLSSLSSLSRTFKLPIRWLLLAWGLNKFRKGLVRRGERQQGKLANLLAKVPHNEKLVRTRRSQCTTTPSA